MVPNHCVAAYVLGHLERMLEQAVQHFADTACFPGRLVCLFQLAQDLRLSHDHRVQSAGYAQHVFDRAGVRMGVNITVEFVFPATVIAGKPVDGPFPVSGVQGAINLGAVAGGQDGSLVNAVFACQLVEGVTQHGLVECYFFAYLQGCGRMVETESQKRHIINPDITPVRLLVRVDSLSRCRISISGYNRGDVQ